MRVLVPCPGGIRGRGTVELLVRPATADGLGPPTGSAPPRVPVPWLGSWPLGFFPVRGVCDSRGLEGPCHLLYPEPGCPIRGRCVRIRGQGSCRALVPCLLRTWLRARPLGPCMGQAQGPRQKGSSSCSHQRAPGAAGWPLWPASSQVLPRGLQADCSFAGWRPGVWSHGASSKARLPVSAARARLSSVAALRLLSVARVPADEDSVTLDGRGLLPRCGALPGPPPAPPPPSLAGLSSSQGLWLGSRRTGWWVPLGPGMQGAGSCHRRAERVLFSAYRALSAAAHGAGRTDIPGLGSSFQRPHVCRAGGRGGRVRVRMCVRVCLR